MSDDATKDVPGGRSFEERVFARFDALDARLNNMDNPLNNMDARLDSMDNRLDSMDKRFDGLDNRLITLEEKVDRRLMETRPIWEAVQAQIRQLDKKFDLVIKDLYEMRVDVRTLDERVTKLETR